MRVSIRNLFVLMLLCSGTGACVSIDYPVEELEQARLGEIVSDDKHVLEALDTIASLELALLGLGPDIDPIEAANVAGSTVNYAMDLAEQYELTSQPVLHNVMVNYKRKPRGLCIHFAEDILRMLLTKNLTTFDVYWGVAYPTKMFRLEHSSAVITAKGQAFDTGIVLDGWRDSGKLFFSKVKDDERYAWELFDDKVTEEFRLKRQAQHKEGGSSDSLAAE